jgi:hypothetical protein
VLESKVKESNKKLHSDTYCYARFCVCRVAPFYTKTLSAICAGELGVRASSLILMHLAGCKSLSGKA